MGPAKHGGGEGPPGTLRPSGGGETTTHPGAGEDRADPRRCAGQGPSVERPMVQRYLDRLRAGNSAATPAERSSSSSNGTIAPPSWRSARPPAAPPRCPASAPRRRSRPGPQRSPLSCPRPRCTCWRWLNCTVCRSAIPRSGGRSCSRRWWASLRPPRSRGWRTSPAELGAGARAPRVQGEARRSQRSTREVAHHPIRRAPGCALARPRCAVRHRCRHRCRGQRRARPRDRPIGPPDVRRSAEALPGPGHRRVSRRVDRTPTGRAVRYVCVEHRQGVSRASERTYAGPDLRGRPDR